MSARVLVIDDEEALRVSVAKIVSRLGHSVDTAGNATEGLARLAKQPYELVLTDFRLPDLDGLEVIERARQLRPEAEIVLFTGFGSIPLARRLRQQLDDRPDTPLGRIIGQSESIRAVLRVVEQVAPSTATVLIEGPSGTGKELVADALHALSPRRDRPLVKVNCSAIPETLLEAELFGHEKGAFTGALARKDGRFARADGGTLFLDEIGTLGLPIQAKLLRTLQDGTFEPLGSTRTLQSDCRIIAATNTDLGQAVKEGLFREDLYYRLNVIRIAMPPLKERPDDIPLLLGHFLAHHAARNSRSIDGFDAGALNALRAYDWPGNVRELSHAVERAVVLATGRTITRECLPEAIRQAAGPEPVPLPDSQIIAVPVGTPLDDVEKLVIAETLRHTGGNKAQAASLLGISARTIYRKQAPGDAEIE
ncbi:MAG: sigma-54 dependent transcriptional regulator [Vicinamibacterales bacterium]|nr:sigma-54 dependent transcriptional regulator [Vicinamibacterales bacterium]